MTEDGELAGEVVIDTDNFFLQVRRSHSRTCELVIARGGGREDTRAEQCRRIRADHARGDDVADERLALHDASRKNAAGAILCEDGWRNLSRGRNEDGSRVAAKV